MKKTSLILLSTLCALAANAADINGSTDSASRPVVKDIADNQDVRILPNADAPEGSALVSMKDATVKSLELTEKSGTGYTLSFGNTTIDNNGSEKDFALRNSSKFNWYLTSQSLNLVNSGSDTAVSNYEMGTATILGEDAAVNVNTNAAFSGTTLIFKSSSAENVGVSLTIGSASKMVNVSYDVAATTFDNASKLVVNSGSTFTSGKTAVLNFGANASFEIAGTFNYGNTANSLDFNGKGKILNSGVLVLSQALKINSGAVVEIAAGRADTAIRKSDEGSGRVILSGGTLKIASKDAVATNIGLDKNTSSTISISADNSFQSLYFNENTHLSLILTDNAKASFKGVGAATSVDMSIEGFAADSVFFNSNTWWNNALITATDAEGNVYQKDQLELVAAGEDFAQYGKYVLSVKQIPEPSTYAAVFGALALGLALYRRRK